MRLFELFITSLSTGLAIAAPLMSVNPAAVMSRAVETRGYGTAMFVLNAGFECDGEVTATVHVGEVGKCHTVPDTQSFRSIFIQHVDQGLFGRDIRGFYDEFRNCGTQMPFDLTNKGVCVGTHFMSAPSLAFGINQGQFGPNN